MADQSFAEALNEQVAYEFAASQQYIAIAVHYDAETLPQLAAHFYRQAVEERNHAMIMVQYLLDTDERVRIPDVKSQQTTYDGVVGPVKMALEQEKRVSDEIFALFKLARDAGDFRAEQFLTWFVKEQVEEVKSMTDLLNVVERAKETPLLIEEFLAREQSGDEGDDPTARPRPADALDAGDLRGASPAGPAACDGPAPRRPGGERLAKLEDLCPHLVDRRPAVLESARMELGLARPVPSVAETSQTAAPSRAVIVSASSVSSNSAPVWSSARAGLQIA
jgi:ferritin